jgi:hypothetical protein
MQPVTISSLRSTEVRSFYIKQLWWWILQICIYNGTAKCGLHDKRDGNCSAVSNRTVSVPTAYITDEVDENSSIANGTVSATGTIIDNNNAPTVATTSLATEGSDVNSDSLP